MPKRQASQIEEAEARPLRRSARNFGAASSPASKMPKQDESAPEKPKGLSKKTSSKSKKSPTEKAKKTPRSPAPARKEDAKPARAASKPVPLTLAVASTPSAGSDGQQFWLMKAEPEPRIENGKDVSFSITSLRNCTEPEPWDGIRNYVARNNLRAMRKGDLAFFYHSNCKNPGIVGVMEIVREATPDYTAHDPKEAYYDPKDDPKNPKWSVVHVEFRREFQPDATIGLQELKKLGAGGGPLTDMQMLRQSRLSISKVSKVEWDFIMGLVEEREKGGK